MHFYQTLNYKIYCLIKSNKKSSHSSICDRQTFFSLANFLNISTTLPLEPITFPYLTTEKDVFFIPVKLLAAINNLSEHNFVAPYKLIGLTALSVDNAITFLTPQSIAAFIIFSAPLMLVLIHSIGLYSDETTCLSAAA